jgi:RND superfamily putative drug exporter
MGFAVSFGIAVAAFVMAMFFTPSLTALIGHAAWWPGNADRTRETTAGPGTGSDTADPISGAGDQNSVTPGPAGRRG